MEKLAELNAAKFYSKIDLEQKKLNMQSIDVSDIDPNPFNPRQVDNNRFNELKESIRKIGLQQYFAVAYNPKKQRYATTKGGNTRLRVIQTLYQETGDKVFREIPCIVEEFDVEKNKAQSIIAQLIENEARGELVLADKARALWDLEQDFFANLEQENRHTSSAGGAEDKKDSAGGAESLGAENKKDSAGGAESLRTKNYNKTNKFLQFLANNGYSLHEQTLSIFRFTSTKLVGCLDYHLNKGLGSKPIADIRKVYNNAKRLYLDHENKSYEKSEDNFDKLWAEAVKKYNSKKSFDFDKFVNIIASQFNRLDHLFGTHGNEFNISPMVKKLLETKKDREEQAQKQEVIEQITEPTKDNKDIPDTANTEPSSQDNVEPIENNTSNNEDGAEDDVSSDKAITPSVPDSSDDASIIAKNVDLSEKRTEIRKVVRYICSAYNFDLENITIDIDYGCGYLVINKPKPTDFDKLIVFNLLLAFSLATDANYLVANSLKPSAVPALLGIKSNIDKELKTIYQTQDPNQLLTLLEKLHPAQAAFMPVPSVINMFKNKLNGSMWQKFSELEFLQYQIAQIARNEVDIWTE